MAKNIATQLKGTKMVHRNFLKKSVTHLKGLVHNYFRDFDLWVTEKLKVILWPKTVSIITVPVLTSVTRVKLLVNIQNHIWWVTENFQRFTCNYPETYLNYPEITL